MSERGFKWIHGICKFGVASSFLLLLYDTFYLHHHVFDSVLFWIEMIFVGVAYLISELRKQRESK